MLWLRWKVVVAAIAMVLLPALARAELPFIFRDAGDEAGLFPHVSGTAGHGVVWGDADGDGWPDLYVGAFGGHPYGSKPNMFFRNEKGKFRLDDQESLRVLGRGNGGVFADFDNDGDLDLYVTNHAIDGKSYGQPHYNEPNHLFRNDGGGKFVDVSAASGACFEGIAARSCTVLDCDGDGRLDLLVGECFFQGGMSRSRLYRNLGELKFENVTAKAGLPENVTGFGVAAGDVNGDTWVDIFLAGRNGGNRLFVNDGQGKFREPPQAMADFTWKYTDTADDTACGCCIADVNRDGRNDIIVGSHCDRPWFTGGVPVRLYLNQGNTDGLPAFRDVTESVGLVPLPMKSPHVEARDFDNDGWPDIYTSIVKFAGGKAYPMIFKNDGVRDGLPRFREGTLAMNDFPTEEDKKQGDVVAFFERMEREGKIVYTAPGASADYDRDGRLDLFLANWWVTKRSLLLRNETPERNWLDVQVQWKGDGQGGASSASSGPVNPMGIGSFVRVYAAGNLGNPNYLVGTGEIAAGYGYASGQEAIAHFGLSRFEACDVEITLPCGRGRLERKGVKANQRLVVAP